MNTDTRTATPTSTFPVYFDCAKDWRFLFYYRNGNVLNSNIRSPRPVLIMKKIDVFPS